MPLWELTPTNITHPYWRASSHRRRVVVRAATASRACGIAATEFETEEDGGTRLHDLLSPWLTRALVKVGRLEPGEHAEAGQEGILEPKGRAAP